MTQSECTSEVNFRLCKSVFATLATQGIYMISLHIPAMVISTKITYIPLRKLKPFESKHIVLAFCLVVHFCLI